MSEPQPAYLSIKQFSEFSGLSVATIRRRLRDGSISSHQPGGRKKKRLIPADALRNLSPGAEATVSETAGSANPNEVRLPQTRRGRQPSWKKAPS